VERRRRGRWSALGRLRADGSGMVTGTLPMRGRARLRLVDARTSAASATWTVGARHDLVPRP